MSALPPREFDAAAVRLAMERQRKAGTSLQPGAVDGAVIDGNFSLIGGVDGLDFKLECRAGWLQDARLNAIDTLVEAVQGSHERTMIGAGNVQNEMEGGVSGLQCA